jgi:hypothetical protein
MPSAGPLFMTSALPVDIGLAVPSAQRDPAFGSLLFYAWIMFSSVFYELNDIFDDFYFEA